MTLARNRLSFWDQTLRGRGSPRIRKQLCSRSRMLAGPSTGRSDPKRFFSGQEPSWSDIRDEIAPPRTIYNALFEAVFPGIADPSVPNSAFLVTGAAGTGKTTRYLRRNPN